MSKQRVSQLAAARDTAFTRHHDDVQATEALRMMPEAFAHSPLDPIARNCPPNPLLADRQTESTMRHGVVAHEHGKEAIAGATRRREDMLELGAVA